MPILNSDVAGIFDKVADFLDIKGENQFRIRAYRNASRTIGSLSKGVSDMVAQGEDLTRLPGIGADLAAKIKEIVETGKLKMLEDLMRELPPGLDDLMKIPGLGPKRIKLLYSTQDICSVDDLRRAAEGEKLRDIPGFGEKTEANILEQLKHLAETKKAGERTKINIAEQVVEPLIAYLKKVKGVKEAVVAGSYRRRMETVGDLDVLTTCSAACPVMDKFVKYEDVDKILAHGETKSSVVLRTGLQVDVRVVPEESYGAALLYFTGSKAHNIAVRTIAVKKKLKINEYGIFRGKQKLAGRTEEEVYRRVGLPYIEPELREDRGEIEAARQGRLPRLVTFKDIRGDLHVHSTSTDGQSSIREMAEAAAKLGYEYIALTDHSHHVTVARGLDAKRMLRQVREIDRLNAKLKGLLILKAVELDILEDGRLDLPDDVLKELDVIVCSVHYKFNLPREKQTERIIRAMDNPHFQILSHPTGRLINERRPHEVDLEKVMTAAKERGVAIELNAHPDRLDLDDVHCQTARELGIKISISTDAHHVDDLLYIRFGIGQARRGWLEPGDVLNTRRWPELRKILKRK
ncbi:MAG: DNA polymerase III [Candidatus Aminicenantes bacterium RBG_16_63_16]|nr:MAG: DNA polymerase III [Candidatus Aminicenantes bacterium RBG_16_63_16]